MILVALVQLQGSSFPKLSDSVRSVMYNLSPHSQHLMLVKTCNSICGSGMGLLLGFPCWQAQL